MTAARVSPSVALAAYAEAWISGAKVVVFGDALSPLAERLVERGARHVQVYDVDGVRAREAAAGSTSKHISHAPLELAGSSSRDGAFDVGIVEDLASAGKNPKGLLATLARSLSRRGLALIGSRNPDVPARLIRGAVAAEQPLGYYDFYEAVSHHFDEVRMLGQTPFVGYAIADFSAADANDVRIDTALLPSGAEEPEWFLALGSALPVSPDAFSVIQLPIADVDLGASTGRAELEPESMERVENAEARIRELEAALAELAAEGAREAEKHAAERARDAEKHAAERTRDAEKFAAERAREAEKHAAERARDAEKSAREAEKHARDAEKQAGERREGERKELEKGLGQKLQALQAELQKREEWLAGLESRAATADERADQAQAQLEQAAKEQRKTKEQIARLEQQLEDERRSKRQLEEHARAHEQELAKRDRRLESETQRTAELASQTKALAARVAELTAALAQSERAAKKRAEEGDEEVRAELLQLEALLKDRAAEVARLTEALHETERFGRQLIIKLGEVEASSAGAPESPDLQGLTRRNAELAADLEAARWTISSLEANVGMQPTASASAAVNQRRDDMTPAEPAPGADG
jgi:hypothetical protein